jgi:hypothetical protein
MQFAYRLIDDMGHIPLFLSKGPQTALRFAATLHLLNSYSIGLEESPAGSANIDRLAAFLMMRAAGSLPS